MGVQRVPGVRKRDWIGKLNGRRQEVGEGREEIQTVTEKGTGTVGVGKRSWPGQIWPYFVR